MKKIATHALALSIILFAFAAPASAQSSNSSLTNVPLVSQSATLDNNTPQVNSDGTVSAGQNNPTNVTTNASTLNGQTQSANNSSAQSAAVTNCSSSDGFVSLSCIPGFAQAETSSGLQAFFNTVYQLCIGAAALIAVVQIIRAGIMRMTAGGNASQVSQSNELIRMSLIGLLLVLSPVIVFSIVNKNILTLQINGIENLNIAPKSAGNGQGNNVGGASDTNNGTQGTQSDTTSSLSAPSKVTSSNVTSSSVALSWPASASAATNDGEVSPSMYKVYDNGNLVQQTSNTSTTISGLTANSQHSFTVSAVDSTGKETPQSPATAVTITPPAQSGGYYVISGWSWYDNSLITSDDKTTPHKSCWQYSVQHAGAYSYTSTNGSSVLQACQQDLQSLKTTEASSVNTYPGYQAEQLDYQCETAQIENPDPRASAPGAVCK
jgi:hypothetical protein